MRVVSLHSLGKAAVAAHELESHTHADTRAVSIPAQTIQEAIRWDFARRTADCQEALLTGKFDEVLKQELHSRPPRKYPGEPPPRSLIAWTPAPPQSPNVGPRPRRKISDQYEAASTFGKSARVVDLKLARLSDLTATELEARERKLKRRGSCPRPISPPTVMPVTDKSALLAQQAEARRVRTARVRSARLAYQAKEYEERKYGKFKHARELKEAAEHQDCVARQQSWLTLTVLRASIVPCCKRLDLARWFQDLSLRQLFKIIRIQSVFRARQAQKKAEMWRHARDVVRRAVLAYVRKYRLHAGKKSTVVLLKFLNNTVSANNVRLQIKRFLKYAKFVQKRLIKYGSMWGERKALINTQWERVETILLKQPERSGKPFRLKVAELRQLTVQEQAIAKELTGGKVKVPSTQASPVHRNHFIDAYANEKRAAHAARVVASVRARAQYQLWLRTTVLEKILTEKKEGVITPEEYENLDIEVYARSHFQDQWEEMNPKCKRPWYSLSVPVLVVAKMIVKASQMTQEVLPVTPRRARRVSKKIRKAHAGADKQKLPAVPMVKGPKQKKSK